MSLAMWFDLGGDASLVVGVVMVRVVTQQLEREGLTILKILSAALSKLPG